MHGMTLEGLHNLGHSNIETVVVQRVLSCSRCMNLGRYSDHDKLDRPNGYGNGLAAPLNVPSGPGGNRGGSDQMMG